MYRGSISLYSFRNNQLLQFQTKVEAGITKIERLDHNIGVRHSDMEAEITEAVEVMASVKSGIATIENKVMNVTRHILEVRV